MNGDEEDYLLDLTREYHNLLGIQKDNNGQYFYFDGNVTAMEEINGRTAKCENRNRNGRTSFPGLHYYLQDELGSPMRVNGFKVKENSAIGKSTYLAYGYDEFGNDLGRELEEAGIPNVYDRQGMEQPFGYTGYRYDEVSETYFAQARETQPRAGRFTAEDVIKGNGAVAKTLNEYSYCLNNSLSYVDWDGKSATVAILVVAGLTLLLTGCGKELDESEIEPMPSATSDHEFTNSMEVYNSKEYIERTNCYAYALDIINNPLTGEKFGFQGDHTYSTPWGLQPGMLCGEYSHESYVKSLHGTDEGNALFISHVKNDVDKLGLEFQEYTEGMTGGYIVAIAIRDNPDMSDYHFYRENGDGTWSSKLGGKKVKTGIENPQIDAYKEGYNIFLGYYYITEKEECSK